MIETPDLSSAGLIAGLPLADRAKADLQRRMAEPSRFYHTAHHLDLLWSRHRRFSGAADFPGRSPEALIALAIAFHDSVFVGGALDNEERSAILWLEVSATATTLSEADRLWVADTVRATGDHLVAAAYVELADSRDYARQWVLDLDLTPLGEDPDVFDANMVLLNAEVPHVAPPERQANLWAAIRHFASARPLYRCRPIADAFQCAAKRNFERHLDERPCSPGADGATA